MVEPHSKNSYLVHLILFPVAGVVLVVVIWVLALVWLLAVVFLMAATTEKSVSSSYYFSSRAEFAARSGIEVAISKIYESMESKWSQWPPNDQSWQFKDGPGTLLEDAFSPSFAKELLKINSKQQHISGSTSPDDVFKLKVTDTQGQINVNDGITLPKDHAVNASLTRIINILGRQVGITTLKLGDEILKNRPSGGYQNKYELLKAVNGKMDIFNRFKDHVTTHSWKNPSVAMPVPLSSYEVSKGSYPINYNRPSDANGPIYRYGHYSTNAVVSDVQKIMSTNAKLIYDGYFATLKTDEMVKKLEGISGTSNMVDMGLKQLINLLKENASLRTKTGTGTSQYYDEHGNLKTYTYDIYDYDSVYRELAWNRLSRYVVSKSTIPTYLDRIKYWIPAVSDPDYKLKIQARVNEIEKISRDFADAGNNASAPINDFYCTADQSTNEKAQMRVAVDIVLDLMRKFVLAEVAAKDLVDLIEKIPSQTPYGLCFWPDRQSLGISTYDALNPQWIELVERAPVNINTASREVLVSLISGLQGFFVMNPKIGEPRNIFYYWMGHQYLYVPSLQLQSQIGSIYKTLPFIDGTDAQAPEGFPAQIIADEIIACKNQTLSPMGIDYKNEGFGGPFRTWAQFNKFVDYLVERGVLVDKRNIYFDEDFSKIQSTETEMPSRPVQIPEPSLTIPSTAQRRMASQAMADVLKANFNPNLHLNELNQNKILHNLVDKTDLILNTTEFCFLPMGYFEIESLGLVLGSPSEGDTNRDVIAKKRMATFVKLYDVYYESDQANFYQGEFGDKKSGPQTSNGKAVETGPEPDNGSGPKGCNYSGFVSLSSLGGTGSRGNGTLYTALTQKAEQTDIALNGIYPNAIRSQSGSKELDEDIRSHFQFDHFANYHSLGDEHCKPFGPFQGIRPYEKNFADKTETGISPYSPVNGDRFRLARSFRNGDNTNFFTYSPSDLRSDGAYFEFNSAIGYKPVPFKESFVASFWLKPNFYPELTNKVRTFFSASDQTFVEVINLNIWSWEVGKKPWVMPSFGLFFFPGAHGWEDPWKIDTSTYNRSGTSSQDLNKIIKESTSRRSSLGFFNTIMYLKESDGSITFIDSKQRGGIGTMTPTLNHNLETYCVLHPGSGTFCANPTAPVHQFETVWQTDKWKVNHRDHWFTGDDGKFNYLRDHEWMHVTIAAKTGASKELQILINGTELPNTDQNNIHISSLLSLVNDPKLNFDFTKITGNSLRIGGEYSSKLMQSYRGYYADSTIDEFYFWADNYDIGINRSKELFNNGRYYKPAEFDPTDGLFTSANIPLEKGRALAKLSGQAGSSSKIKILGVNWTCYAEEHAGVSHMYGVQLVPHVYEHADPRDYLRIVTSQDPNGYWDNPVCEISVVQGGKKLGPYKNELFSTVKNLYVDDSQPIKYQVKFKIGRRLLNELPKAVLATPIFDDISIFYSAGGPVQLSLVDLEGPVPVVIGGPNIAPPPPPPPPPADNQPPKAVPVSPTDKTTLIIDLPNNVTTTVTVKVTDPDNNANSVTWFQNGIPRGTDYFTTPSGGDKSKDFTFTTPGDYKIVAVPKDKTGKTGYPVDFDITVKPPTFFDTPVTAKNIVFVLDRSSSMREPIIGYTPDLNLANKLGINIVKGEGGYSKWEILKFEMKKLLHELPKGKRKINILYFNHFFGRMGAQMVTLDDNSRNSAFALLDKFTTEGATNIRDPMGVALDMIKAEKASLTGEIAIYLVSDGIANRRIVPLQPPVNNEYTGQLSKDRNTQSIADDITNRNLLVLIKINTFAMSPSNFLKDVADKNNGIYKLVR